MVKVEGSKRKIADNPEVLNEYLTAKKVKFEDSTENKNVTAKVKNRHNKLSKDSSNHHKHNIPTTKTTSSSEKPDWAKLKREKKELFTNRKKKRADYDIAIEAKKCWEQLRKEKYSFIPIVYRLHDILKSHLAKMIMTHDISRIVQWMIKLGTPQIRLAIAEELQPSLRKMLTAGYAVKCVKKMLKFGSVQTRSLVVEAFMGKVVKLMCNVISSPVLEYAYAKCTTPLEKSRMRQEFYSELYRSCKDDKIKSLVDTFRDTPEMKNANLTSTKTNMLRMINKSMSQSSLLYAIMVDFLRLCSKEDKFEVLSRVREWLPVMPNIKDAATVGMMCMWYATNKEKKAAMKSLKEKVLTMAKSNHLQWILLALFNSTDDTVVLNKILLPEVVNNVKELADDKFGRRIVVHLVSYYDSTLFHPREISVLKEGEEFGTAKKDPEQRKKEILDYVSNPFLQSVTDDPKFWFSNSSLSLVVLAILKTACGEERDKALTAVAKFVADPLAQAKQESAVVPLVSHSGICFTLKKVFQIDSNKVFCKSLAEFLSDSTVKFWLTHNQGCFLLLRLLETKDETIVPTVKGLLEPLQELLSEQNSTGANILKKSLNDCQ